MSNCVRIDAPWHIDERRISDHLLYYMRSGTIQAHLNNDTIALQAGEMLWVQPQVSQAFTFNSKKPGDIYFLRFYFDNVATHVLHQDYLRAAVDQNIERPWDQITKLNLQHGQHSNTMLRCLLAELVIPLLEHNVDANAGQDGLSHEQQQLALQFIRQHIHLRFHVEQIAQHLDMNPDYFARQFKKSLGLSPQSYIKQERVRQACGLLSESGRSVSEVAELLGYEDPYFFSRQFKSVMDQSPRHWLRSQR